MSLVGKRLRDRYAIVRLIGQGAMGSVYEARHLATDRKLAVKVIHDRLTADETLVRRFMIEARAVGRIASSHVAQVVDVDTDPDTGLPFMVLEHLDGEDIESLVRRLGRLSPDLALRIAAQASLGLETAHAAGIVHRDIKPANLFLARGDGLESVVKVVDFGVAKLAADDGGSALTRSGGIVGSPLYMSPEQARGVRDLDARTDVWSLGVVLYQMLAGAPPHADVELVGDLLVAILTKPPEPIKSLAPWVPPEVARVVHRALQIQRDQRFSSMAELRAELVALLPRGAAITADAIVPADVGDEGPASDAGSDEPKVPQPAALGLAPTERDSAPVDVDGLSTAEFVGANALTIPALSARAPKPANLAQGSALSESSPSAPAPLARSSQALEAAPTVPPKRSAWPWILVALGASVVAGVAALVTLRIPGAPSPPLNLPLPSPPPNLQLPPPGGSSSFNALPGAPPFPFAPSGDIAPTDAPEPSASPGSSASSAPSAEPERAFFRPCADPRRTVRQKAHCDAPARAWCNQADQAVACCAVGLVPVGSEGACACAPGGTRDPAARRSGCPAAAPEAEWKAKLQATVRPHFGDFRVCHQAALTKLPKARGEIALYFEIDSEGRVVEALVEKATFPDPETQSCILKIMRALRFPPPPEGNAAVTYPLILSTSDE